jgi:hypothetical protein
MRQVLCQPAYRRAGADPQDERHRALIECLLRFRPEFVACEEELHAVRFPFDPAPPMDMLMLHFCGEVRLTQWYKCAAEWHTELVIKFIYETISSDEGRHGGRLRHVQ